MLSKLIRLLRGAPAEPLREVVDPVLGACVPDQEQGWWRASVPAAGRQISFTIGGGVEPDPLLLSRARRIAGELDAFERRVIEFLHGEAARFAEPEIRAEIEALRVEDVCLFWPDRPNDGMIYFEGSSDERLWRCDYIGGRCQYLVFDD